MSLQDQIVLHLLALPDLDLVLLRIVDSSGDVVGRAVLAEDVHHDLQAARCKLVLEFEGAVDFAPLFEVMDTGLDSPHDGEDDVDLVVAVRMGC